MAGIGEQPPMGGERLANLGDVPPEDQRAEMYRILAEQGLVAIDSPPEWGENPLNDIEEMRSMLLRDFHTEISQRLGPQPRMNFAVEANLPLFPVSRIFDQTAARNHIKPGTYPYQHLVMRSIDASLLSYALESGSDKLHPADIDDLGDYEKQAMKEFAINSGRRVLHGFEVTPGADPILIFQGHALLIYAPDCLQAIAPEYRDLPPPAQQFYAFVDPRVRREALIGFVTQKEKPVGKVAAAQTEAWTERVLDVGRGAVVAAS